MMPSCEKQYFFALVAMVTKQGPDWLDTGANVTQKRNNRLTPYLGELT